MLAVADATAGDCQILVWNLRPIQKGELLIPELESVLHPLRNDVLV